MRRSERKRGARNSAASESAVPGSSRPPTSSTPSARSARADPPHAEPNAQRGRQTKSPVSTRVFLVDDHPIVRKALQLLIDNEEDLGVCGGAEDAPAALGSIRSAQPVVVIVDLSLKAGNGIDLIKQLRALYPKLKLLVLTMWEDAIHIDRAMRADAHGYLTKEAGTDKIILALRALARGRSFASGSRSAHCSPSSGGPAGSRPLPHHLMSDRELEVLELIGSGLGSSEIARRIGISLKTVQSHRQHLKYKLRLSRAHELVACAHDWLHRRQDQPRTDAE